MTRSPLSANPSPPGLLLITRLSASSCTTESSPWANALASQPARNGVIEVYAAGNVSVLPSGRSRVLPSRNGITGLAPRGIPAVVSVTGAEGVFTGGVGCPTTPRLLVAPLVAASAVGTATASTAAAT